MSSRKGISADARVVAVQSLDQTGHYTSHDLVTTVGHKFQH